MRLSTSRALDRGKAAQFEGMLQATIGQKQHAGSKSERWSRVELGEIVQFKSGGTPNRSNINYWNGDIPWIGAKRPKIIQSRHIVRRRSRNLGLLRSLWRPSEQFSSWFAAWDSSKTPACYRYSTSSFNQDIKVIDSKAERSPRFLRLCTAFGQANENGSRLTEPGMEQEGTDRSRSQ